jgi:hypothetical protein
MTTHASRVIANTGKQIRVGGSISIIANMIMRGFRGFALPISPNVERPRGCPVLELQQVCCSPRSWPISCGNSSSASAHGTRPRWPPSLRYSPLRRSSPASYRRGARRPSTQSRRFARSDPEASWSGWYDHVPTTQVLDGASWRSSPSRRQSPTAAWARRSPICCGTGRL